MALSQAPLNLDPRYATDAASERINRLVYRPLVDFDEHSRPVPALATWRQVSAQHYRFTLNPQIQHFHDGSLLTARDVAATYQSLLGLHNSPHTAEFANISDVKAIDDNVIDFELHQPDSSFPAKLIIGILPAALIAQGHDFAHYPIGSGPLKFISWGSTLRLERVLDRQQFALQEVRDPTVRVLKLMRGEADLLQGDLQPELVAYLRRQKGIAVQSGKGANFSYIGFNMQDAQLKNPLVRRAIAHAINREAIVRLALVDGSREAEAILPPEHWAANPDLAAYRYDPELACSLLQQAGVKLPLKLVYKTSTDAQRVRLATVIQAQMQSAGITLEIRSLDWGTFFDDIKHGKFQLYGLTWVGIKTPEINRLAFYSDAIPPRGANRGRFQDASMDGLIRQAESGEEGGWRKVAAYAHEALPYIPLWYEGQFVAMREGLENYSLKPDGNWDGLVTIRRRQ
jgi:peptide/nickel transport system substrate-binding protein